MTGTGSGQIVWGRGTIDDKGALVAILEAVDALIESGFTPRHDVYLSFGHNEETSGGGALAAVATLRQRGIRPALVLDEGGAVVDGIFPGVAKPAAMIGVSEKGTTVVTLTVRQTGGHASTPPAMTATVRLARAITRLNRHPFPSRLGPTNLEMVSTMGANMTGPLRAVFTRPRLFRPVLAVLLGRLSDETRATVRTTTAVTQLSGSLAANALAEEASAVISTRIAVGSSVDATLRRMRRVIHDPLVSIRATDANEPSPVSPTSGPAWERLASSLGVVYPEAIVTPYVQLGASDSRHFTTISDTVYRFTPFELSSDERAALHARNERIHVATWFRGIEFYRDLITRL